MGGVRRGDSVLMHGRFSFRVVGRQLRPIGHVLIRPIKPKGRLKIAEELPEIPDLAIVANSHDVVEGPYGRWLAA